MNDRARTARAVFPPPPDVQSVPDAAPDDDQAGQRWTLTSAGASFLAGEATAAYLDDPSLEGAARMEAAYVLAEKLGDREGQR